MEHRVLDLEALLRVPYVDPYTGFDISPDGTQVARWTAARVISTL